MRTHESSDRREHAVPVRQERDHALTWAIAIFCVLVACASFARLFYGVDFVDEATQVAVPYRFVLGDTPFVEEQSPIQTSALLSLPFIELYCHARGSDEGVVLFARFVYFALCSAQAAAVAFGFAPWIGRPRAWLVGTACLAFCPLGIASLSYNTWSSGLFTIGLFVGLRTLVWEGSLGWLAFAGAAHLLACVANPSYMLPSLAYAAVVVTLAPRGERARRFALYAGGAVLALTPLGPSLAGLDADTLRNAYHHVRPAQGGWLARATQFANQFGLVLPLRWELGVALGAVWLGARRGFPRVALIAIALVPLFPLLYRRSTTSMWYVAILAAIGTLILLIAWRGAFVRRLTFCVWLPSALAGLAVSVASGTGLLNAGCGLFPILLLSMALAIVVSKDWIDKIGTGAPRALDIAFPVITVGVLIGYQRLPFGDDNVLTLDARVASGPFAGLHTSADKAGYLRSISEDLAAVARDHGYVLFVDHFPAGYLLTSMRPAVRTIWRSDCTGGNRSDCERDVCADIRAHEGPDLVVVRLRSFPLRRGNRWELWPNAVDELLAERFVPVVHRPDYEMFISTP